MTASSAGIARRVRSVPAVAMLREIKAGIPSHVTTDLNAAPQLTPGRNARAHEREYLPLRAYSNIAEAITEVAGRTA
jgi:xanthine dehydrogenase YagT iron-sulfur-binding subunit